MVFTPEEVIEKYGGLLALPVPFRHIAVDVMKAARQVKGLEGLHPQTLAGATLLLLCSVKRKTDAPLSNATNGGGAAAAAGSNSNHGKEHPVRSVDAVSQATLVSVPTIRKTHALLYENRQLVVPESFLSSLGGDHYELTPTKELA